MTFGLANASKKARYVGSISNQNQGGGASKAGLPYQIGRNWHFNDFLVEHCSRNNLKSLQTTFRFANETRNTGRIYNSSYWHVHGT
jgi:hypothetical protein